MLEAGYNTVEELALEGVSIDPEIPAHVDRAKQIGAMAARYIDQITGRTFAPSEETLRIDYKPGDREIILPTPVWEVTKLTVLGVEVGPEDYKLYNRVQSGIDDRDNPKITLMSGWTGRNPDRSPFRSMPQWGRDRAYPLGVEIEGVFGYCDKLPDGTLAPPMAIKRAHAKLVERLIPRAVDPMAQAQKDRERITSESGPDGSYSFLRLVATGSLTGDEEIDNILIMYTRPLQMG